MAWHKLLGQFNQLSRKTARQRRQRKLRLERMERRELLASDLGAIAGVAFVDENGDGAASAGEPPVLVDGGGNLVAPGTPGAQGIQIQLFEDTNTSGTFEPGTDVLIGTDLTDSNGNYRFDGLSLGRYFLQQQAVPELTTPSSLTVDVTNDGGIQTALIDDYSLTTQSVTADSGTPTNTASALASEAIGGERDIEVVRTGGGQVTVFVDANADTLSIGSLGLGTGTALIQYDGTDNSTALNATGLGGVSLTGNAPGAVLDPGAGLVVQTRADQAGEQLFITIYTDAGNASITQIDVPQEPTPVETFVLFSSFTTHLGSGADFNNVGAIEASQTISADTDVVVSIAESRRPDIVEANYANVLPVSLGGNLFTDNSAVGQNNGIQEGVEAGLVGITVDLYQLNDAGDTVDPSSSIPLTSTTTTAGGNYLFPSLEPGHYAVVIPSSQFQNGAPLFGFANSTGNDPASDPDDNIDDDDNGITLPSGDVISETITLESNQEPTDDGDTDPTTNTTVDFGFFPQSDLEISKTENAGQSNIVAGGNVVFDIVVQNLGPLDATNVVVEDVFPAGLTFTGNQNPSGAFTVNVVGSTVTVEMGTIPAGTTASIQLLADIDANQTANVTNTATVAGFEVETDTGNNSDSEVLQMLASDLRIEKTDLTDPVTAGNQLTYEITVTNDGPDSADGVVVVDTLPAGVSFVSGDVDGASNLVAFDSNTGEVTATIGTMADQAVSVVTIVVDVDADAGSLLTNNATVTATPNSDPDSSNNSISEDTAVTRVVDLAIDKQVNGDTIAGQDITYTIVVTNSGPSNASDVSVVDTLDADLTFVSLDPGTSGATVSQVGQELTFDLGSLAAGGTATFSFDVTIASSSLGTIPNSATVSTTDSDSNSSNDTDAVDITAESQVDLILIKDVDMPTAVPGSDQLVYTFNISHDTDSISDAANVVVTDTLPAGLTGVLITATTADGTDFNPTTGVITVSYDAIPNGETRTFTVTADVQDDATGTIVNSGSVASSGTELDPTNNSDDASTILSPDFDVVVLKSVDDTSPNPNDTVTYTVTVENEGPSNVTGVVLSDAVPAGMTLVSATMNGQDGTLDSGVVTFPAVDLAGNETATATLVFTVDVGTDGVVTNTASVPDMTASGENDATNNSSSVDVTVVALADLSISKTVSDNDAQAGASLVYTVTVTNDGPSPAVDVVVEDTLPAGVTFVSGTGPNGETLSETGGVVTYDAGTIASGANFTLTINATIDPTATGNLINSATVSSSTLDDTTNNNAAAATTAVDPESSTISGFVYLDRNNNGVRDFDDPGIEGVEITLSGTDSLGNSVSQVVFTDASGLYSFDGLAQGTYSVAETQPTRYRDGTMNLGTGASAVIEDNVFTELGLASDTDAINFNFGELNQLLSKRLFLASSP